MIKNSTGICTQMIEAARGALSNHVLRIYSGAVPASANDELGSSAQLLVTISGGGNNSPLQFQEASLGVITKDDNQTWTGTIAQSGTPTFYRIENKDYDNGDASLTAVRVQGTVGNNGDLKLGVTTLSVGNPQSIDYFQLQLPEFIGA